MSACLEGNYENARLNPNDHTGAGYGTPGSTTMIATAISGGTGAQWRSSSMTARLSDVSPPETFWTTCPELMGSVIGRWMLKQGVIPWPKGEPPEFDLEPAGDRKFRLTLN